MALPKWLSTAITLTTAATADYPNNNDLIRLPEQTFLHPARVLKN